MEDVLDLIVTDASASEISDRIKDVLFSKASDKIEGIRSNVGASMFDEPEETQEEEYWQGLYVKVPRQPAQQQLELLLVFLKQQLLD